MSAAGSPAESSIELLRKAQAGDLGARDRLCSRYLPALTRWASGRLPARARLLAETGDLVQETMVRTLENVSGITPKRDGALLAYLRTALANRIRDEIRRATRRPDEVAFDEGLNEAPEPTPLEALIGRETAHRYEEALLRLREVHREAIIARLELRLPFEEVARALDKPSADAARMTFRRALVRLAEEMRDE